ncbi:MAG TPA: outer membrane protein assembly factor BamA [Burkholderiales bacterium]|nr:outer membrane protein assembly factor BamA [Burkholderiales bacterium]
MLKKALAASIAAMFTSGAWGAEPFVVKDIRVEGIQRTEAGTVFSYLPLKVGDTLDDQKAAQAVKALFATGFFKDVRLEAENGVLVVIVEERPAISQIDIVGAKEFEPEQLRNALKSTGLAEGRILDKSLLEKAEQELKRQYLSRGRYGASVTTTVTPLDRNRVSVTFTISEGDVAKIRQINIVGSQAFKEKDLLDLFVLSTPNWLSWYTKNDQYSKQKLSADLETLRSHYLNAGYLEFAVDSTQVSITPDKRDIYITIAITEGQKYKVSDVKLAGDLLVPEDELRKLIQIKPGETFSRERLTESTKMISDRLGDEGYAFANVNAVPELDREKQEVAFTLFVDPGRRVYVRRINIAGNTRTQDHVIRREFRQMESAWYSGEKINNSKRRVDRLGYFKEVNVETPAVTGTTDQVDVNLSVVEKPTGALMLGAGFSSSEGIVLNASISQANFLGTGNFVSLQINSGDVNTVYALSFTNPYWTVNGVSIGYDLYKRDLDSTDLAVGAYTTSTLGAAVRFGYPLGETDSIFFGLGYEKTDIGLFADSPPRYVQFVNDFGSSVDSLPGTLSWARDRRDSAIYTTSGTVQKASAEVGMPGFDLTYYKLNYQVQWYYPITRDFILHLNGEIGYADGYDDKALPFFKNFYAGGISSVRGYEAGTIGPKDIFGDALGGNERYIFSAEVLFPVPGLRGDKSTRMGVFFDAGMVRNNQVTDAVFDEESLRYSVGLVGFWISPFGPLKFAVAYPINPSELDKTQSFQFQVGSTF